VLLLKRNKKSGREKDEFLSWLDILRRPRSCWIQHRYERRRT